MFNRKYRFNQSHILILLFIATLIGGTIALKLPLATTIPITWVDAIFTATSALTVTGLTVVDTAIHFTRFGHVVIMLLIQLGGLGIMSFAVLLFMMLGKKIGLSERLTTQSALNQSALGGIIKLVRNIFIYSFTIELVGMLLLAIKWVPEYGLSEGLFVSLFHAISAFNNAGFSVWSANLAGYVGDPLVNSVIAALFIIGGIGFTVLADIVTKKRFKTLTLHAKIMLMATLILNVAAMLIFFILEYNNVQTLGSLPTLTEQLWASFFQGATPRTAGFNTLDIGSLTNATLLFTLFLMFVGAGSASTGGGIKLTTFIVIVAAVLSFLHQKKETTIGRRAIKDSVIVKALAILSMSLMFIFVAVFSLTVTEQLPFLTLLFEVVSAFGTVGLSMGITPSLTSLGKGIIVIIMVIGKLGPLTLAFALAKPIRAKTRYPSEDILTG